MSTYSISMVGLNFSITTKTAAMLATEVILVVGMAFLMTGLYKLISSQNKDRSSFEKVIIVLIFLFGIALTTLSILIFTDAIDITRGVNRFLSEVGVKTSIFRK
ncbi:hypothetical protein NEFER03_0546 [Nematocida sp. LUAm3]|nr:hypothetical protein NEFER03_0546 [Nematocida sp. LUAm3]KAI5175513.1 hypothetical protein NEFER02_1419 [Nematocida sp. LUAm2]KAI5178457.1 hypothetical protein NEFER01_1604 [Nematocida sp. LUAm1]